MNDRAVWVECSVEGNAAGLKVAGVWPLTTRPGLLSLPQARPLPRVAYDM